MRTLAAKTVLLATLLGVGALGVIPGDARAQSSSSVAPMVIPVSGQFPGRTGTAVLQVALYDGKDDPAPRWVESHTVALDAQGGYTVQFGSASDQAALQSMFVEGPGARWLGVAIENEPEAPNARVMLVSVPYAAKAASAETLGGKTASEFVQTSTFREDLRTALTEEGLTTESDEVSTEAILNSLQKSNGSSGLLDSTVYEVGGNVGIGTTAPGYPLQVRRAGGAGSLGITIDSVSSHRDVIYHALGDTNLVTTGHVFSTRNSNALDIPRMVITGAGNVGIGTTAPGYPLQVRRAGGAGSLGITIDSVASHRDVIYQALGDSASVTTGHVFSTRNGNAVDVPSVVITGAGNVGIGTTSPTSKLHVAGAAFVSGDMTVNGNIAAKYQDVAEWVDAAEPIEAGTVVIIDEKAHNRVTASMKAFDTRVAGAVSAQPGLILGERGEGRVLVAQSGRVRIKADARHGAIKPGDLLVTAPRAGYAMKAKSPKPGTVVGKALEPLETGTGEILVLLTLQ